MSGDNLERSVGVPCDEIVDDQDEALDVGEENDERVALARAWYVWPMQRDFNKLISCLGKHWQNLLYSNLLAILSAWLRMLFGTISPTKIRCA